MVSSAPLLVSVIVTFLPVGFEAQQAYAGAGLDVVLASKAGVDLDDVARRALNMA